MRRTTIQLLLLLSGLIPVVTHAQQSLFSKSFQLPAPKDGGFSLDGYWIWDPSVIEQDGVYHMYASRVPGSYRFHPAWMMLSEIIHASSDRLEGPYRFVDVAIDRRGPQYWDGNSVFNPHVLKFGNKFYMFYVGTRHPFEEPRPEDMDLKGKWTIVSRSNKRIGLAVSASPNGPWERCDTPTIDVEPGTFYSFLISNPAPVILPSGETYVMFKGRHYTPTGRHSDMQLGIAYSPQIGTEPFRILNDRQPVFDLQGQGEAEDPFLWYEQGCFYAIFKDQRGRFTGEIGAGVLAFSEDCIHWQIAQPAKAYSRTIEWSDGTAFTLGNRERPFIFFRDGKPVCLFNAAMTGTGHLHDGDKAWNLAVPLRTAEE